jgi:DNA-binding MarR family transcriptional regulator
LLLLSRIELDGPQRPHDLATTTGMTTGGLSKLLDRMEAFGVVHRRPGRVAGDRRAVFVDITDEGREFLRLASAELAERLPETEALVGEIVALLERRSRER